MHERNDDNLNRLTKNNEGIRIPSKPDVGVRIEIERAISSDSPNCCCQVEVDLDACGKSVMYSLDSNGHRKKKGGDEFYVRYEEFILNDIEDQKIPKKDIKTQAVAFIADKGDGSYELDFCTTPMHPIPHSIPCRTAVSREGDDSDDSEKQIFRTISVYFEYTDKIGFLSPPSKQDWLNGGYSHKQYEYQLPSHLHRPYIRAFSPPIANVDLSKFDQVFAFGDSTFCQFLRQRPNKKGKYYFRDNLRIVGEKVRMGLNSETVDSLLELLKEDEIERELYNNSDGKKKALIVGSCLWDILSADDVLQGSEFKDHCDSCRKYIVRLRRSYPDVTILWKSPMAVHIHRVDLQRVVEHDRATATLFGVNRIKYMSNSRSFFLYKVQKQLMEELSVPMLDLYEATHLSADQLYPSDGRHYKPDLNRKMISWFYASDANPNERKYFRQVV